MGDEPSDKVVSALTTGLQEIVEIGYEPGLLDIAMDDGGVDSMDLIEIVMVMEEELDVSTSQSDFEGVETLRGVTAVFDRLIQA